MSNRLIYASNALCDITDVLFELAYASNEAMPSNELADEYLAIQTNLRLVRDCLDITCEQIGLRINEWSDQGESDSQTAKEAKEGISLPYP